VTTSRALYSADNRFHELSNHEELAKKDEQVHPHAKTKRTGTNGDFQPRSDPLLDAIPGAPISSISRE
jgi:hypothetical protein